MPWHGSRVEAGSDVVMVIVCRHVESSDQFRLIEHRSNAIMMSKIMQHGRVQDPLTLKSA